MTDTNNPQSSGSQDSIDTLDAILRTIPGSTWYNHPTPLYFSLKERLTAWHNTQLKAEMKMLEAIMNKRLDDAGIDNFSARTYLEEAIDDMQAKFGQTEKD